jgi:hypothetical protein
LRVRFYKTVAPEETLLNNLIYNPSILSRSLEKRIKPRYWNAPCGFRGKYV